MASSSSLAALKTQPVGLGVAIHEAHESIPLKLAAHVELGLNDLRLPVYELGLDIRGRQRAL